MVSADEVGLKKIIGRTILTRQHGWLGGAFNEKLELAPWKTIRIPHVATMKLHARLLQARKIQFRTPAVEVVQADQVGGRPPPLERQGEIRADEPGSAGDENAHFLKPEIKSNAEMLKLKTESRK
jgi:hypothetical protein